MVVELVDDGGRRIGRVKFGRREFGELQDAAEELGITVVELIRRAVSEAARKGRQIQEGTPGC